MKKNKICALFSIFLCFGPLNGCLKEPWVPEGESSNVSEEKKRQNTQNSPLDGFYETVPSLPPKGFFLKPLAENVYFFSDGHLNTMFIVTKEGVVVIDPLKGLGKKLKQAVSEVTQQPIKFMIYSHSHISHIGDAHLFNNGVQVIAQRRVHQELGRYRDSNRPLPHIAFGASYNLELGEERIQLIYPGPGHGEGNIIIYLPLKKILMFTDVAVPRTVPFKSFATKDIYGQVFGIKKALNYDFDFYVSGHGFREGSRKEMKEIFQYYLSSKKANRTALKKISLKEMLNKSKSKDPYNKLSEYYDAVAQECYLLLKKRWKPRLMGFEAYARSHCDLWTQYHQNEMLPKNSK